MSDNKPGRKPAVNAESILDWFIDTSSLEESQKLLERIQLAHHMRERLMRMPKPKPEAPDAN